MKRNKINRTLVLWAAGALLLAGCSDNFLKEKKVYNSLGDQVFEYEETAQQVLDYVYFCTFQSFNSPIKVDAPELSWSEDYTKCTPEQGGLNDYTKSTVSDEAWDAAKCPKMYGTKIDNKINDDLYTRIRTCNLVIKNVQDSNLSEDAKARLMGQAYFLRVRQYFQLIRTHGGVPYIREPQYPGAEDIYVPRHKTSECVAFMCEDLNRAAALLPGMWPNPATQWGMPTRGTALAYKSRILLWWASPVMNPDYSTDPTRWQAALDAGLEAEEQLVADGFGLYGEESPGTNGSAWSDMFKAYDQVNKEGIWMKIYSTASGAGSSAWEGAIRLTSQGGGNGVSAPAEMVDLFPMADGSRPSAENGYVPELFFADRDPRFYRTFAFPGSYWGLKSPTSSQTTDIWSYGWYTSPDSEFYEDSEERRGPNRLADNIGGNSSVKVRKMSAEEKIGSGDYSRSGVDFMEYRFAELLLNIAECYAGVGELGKCTEYLTRIRKRAGIPQGSRNYGLGTISTKPAAFEACLYERAVELAYEGKRFYDISRWMLFEGGPQGRVNTCQYLGVEPLNGTRRTELYLLAWDPEQGRMYYGDRDPLIEPEEGEDDAYFIAPRVAAVNPDDTRFSEQINALKEFYINYFKIHRGIRWDTIDGIPETIQWKTKCYIFGLNKSTLNFNAPYLEQNTGWPDFSGEDGTFDPLL